MTTNTPTSFVGKHIFTQEEKNQKTEQMLQAMRQKEEIESEFKTSKSNYKSKIDSKDAEIKLTANLLNAGFEDRTYNCLLTKDFEAGKRLYHEIGSNKLVGEEPLTAADYQYQMDLEEKTIRENNEAADQAIDLLHSGEEAPFELSAEETEVAEAGPDPQYSVEPDSNPLEFEETPAVEAEVIDKPLTVVKGGKSKTTGKTGTQSLNEHLSADDYDDPFSNLGSRDNALNLGEDDGDDSDPFSFDDI